VDSVVSKLQETGQHVAKKSDLLFSRTRQAGETFLGEVRGAGRDLVGFVRVEAKGWRRFFTQRTSRLQSEAKSIFTPKTFEREVLVRVDGTLRSLDAKVRERLVALEKGTRKPARRKANGKAKPRARRTSAASARSAVSVAGATASVRH
jgi:hypothetical protein